MKNLFTYSLITLLAFSSCKEIMPTVPPFKEPIPGQPVDTTSDNRKILIEEFTGVGCVNCPAGSREIENLLVANPNNLVAISIHSGFFAIPYVDSKYDFRTEDADNLVNDYFGVAPFAFPSATINREKTTTGSFYVGLLEWAGLIENELEEVTQAALEINHTFDNASGELSGTVTVKALTDIPDDLLITIMITESGVKDYQLLPSGWQSDYSHKHMLREIVTSHRGEVVSATGLTAEESADIDFSFTLPSEWAFENCDLIALVHRNTSDSKEVLNVQDVDITE